MRGSRTELWPDANERDQEPAELFAEDARALPTIHDRHGCVYWIGPVALFFRMPKVRAPSYDVLFRCDRSEFLRVHREALSALRQSKAARGARSARDDAARPAVSDYAARYGRRLPMVERAFVRATGLEVGCIGLELPALHGTSERQVLRSLGLTVGDAQFLLERHKSAVDTF